MKQLFVLVLEHVIYKQIIHCYTIENKKNLLEMEANIRSAIGAVRTGTTGMTVSTAADDVDELTEKIKRK
jgi:hypothetical protein